MTYMQHFAWTHALCQNSDTLYILKYPTFCYAVKLIEDHILFVWSRENSAGIATGYGLDDRGFGVQVPVGSRIFSSPCSLDWLWAHPASYPMGTGGKAARA
jgi:hypothetical protein